jgi:hypothetical protein
MYINGGASRDRTDHLLRAKQALYQMSYGPVGILVGLDGLEPSTPRLSSVCSNQLSYRPVQRRRYTRSRDKQYV